MKNIQRAVRASRKRSEYFQLRRFRKACDSCGCDPCDCNWGHSQRCEIVISRRGNYESNIQKDKTTNN